MHSIIEVALKYVFEAWRKGNRKTRRVLSVLGVVAALGVFLFLFAIAILPHDSLQYRVINSITIGIAIVISVSLFAISAYSEVTKEKEIENKIEEKEKRFRENPQKPEAAWDLARTKLENYLDKNLSQIRTIFTLSIAVMIVGFCFIMYGAVNSLDEAKPGATLVTISGLIINFLGASFLVLYKSIMSQAKDFVNVLERINAVGMSVQIADNIEQDPTLKDTTRSEIAKLLLTLYGTDHKKASTDDKSTNPSK